MFSLINLVVADEFGKGYPVTHLICNSEDELVLTGFFEAIKTRCDPNMKVSSLMTDDDNAYLNRVFGSCCLKYGVW